MYTTEKALFGSDLESLPPLDRRDILAGLSNDSWVPLVEKRHAAPTRRSRGAPRARVAPVDSMISSSPRGKVHLRRDVENGLS